MIEFIVGSREEFWDFVEGISEEDKIALITHIDLDGLGSGVFLEEILKNKINRNLDLIEFTDYGKDMLKNVFEKLKNNKITKVFLTDLNVDSSGFEDFLKLRQEFDVFLIDHHPSENGVNKLDKVIKTSTDVCSSLTIYEIGREKDLISDEEWKSLADAAIIADMGFKGETGLEFLRKTYPELNEGNFRQFSVTTLSYKISSAILYNRSKKKPLKEIYDLIKEKKFSEFDRFYEVIENSVQKELKLADEKAEFYEDKNLYFYFFDLEFNIGSVVSTLFSDREGFKDKAVVFVSKDFNDENSFKASARNQQGNISVNFLLQKSIKGFDKAVAGGHAKAAGATFLKKDFEQFKKNLLENL